MTRIGTELRLDGEGSTGQGKTQMGGIDLLPGALQAVLQWYLLVVILSGPILLIPGYR